MQFDIASPLGHPGSHFVVSSRHGDGDVGSDDNIWQRLLHVRQWPLGIRVRALQPRCAEGRVVSAGLGGSGHAGKPDLEIGRRRYNRRQLRWSRTACARLQWDYTRPSRLDVGQQSRVRVPGAGSMQRYDQVVPRTGCSDIHQAHPFVGAHLFVQRQLLLEIPGPQILGQAHGIAVF